MATGAVYPAMVGGAAVIRAADMAHRPDPAATPVTAAELEASLARLGVRELEERLELSPLLAAGGVQDTDACRCSCECDDTPDDPNDPLFLERIANTRISGTLV